MPGMLERWNVRSADPTAIIIRRCEKMRMKKSEPNECECGFLVPLWLCVDCKRIYREDKETGGYVEIDIEQPRETTETYGGEVCRMKKRTTKTK